MNPFPRLALVVAALAASGCIEHLGGRAPDLPRPAGWVESDPFECYDADLLWETAKLRTARQGYRLDDDATTRAGNRIVSSWKTSLSTTRYDGKRKRRFVEILPDGERKNWWKVRVSVVMQKNGEVDSPLNPAAAKWEGDEPDTEEAEMLAWVIASQFREPGTSREFEDR